MSKSILTKYQNYSIFGPGLCEEHHHLLFGRGIRDLAEEDGIWIPVTAKEHRTGAIPERIHDNPMAEKLSKLAGQLAYEKEYYKKLCEMDEDVAREAFRKRYGKSYL